jgi:hypothetical protein
MTTKHGYVWVFVGLLSLGAIIFGLSGAGPVRSQPVVQHAALEAVSVVEETISYQGVLTDPQGEPLNGTFAMRFSLFQAASGGAPIFESATLNVNVTGGLFNVGLPAPQTVYDGGPLWLSVIINEEVLSPRQQIQPTAYAMSLRPGATVRQVATGTAVRVESTEGIGLHGTGQVYGLYGSNVGSAQGSGYGGYFESATGIGVYGSSTALPTSQNQYVPGVHGRSEHGVGVYGQRIGSGVGVFGQATTGFGVYGTSSGDGVLGVGSSHGVYGSSAGAAPGSGYGGYFTSATGIGVAGRTTANPTGNNVYAPGVHGYSQHGAAILGEAGSGTSAFAGAFLGNVFVQGNLTVTGSKTGYVVDIARNNSPESLERGDLVVVTGVTSPVVGEIPVPLVRKADSEGSRAVIGVVDAVYHVAESEHSRLLTELVEPGDYLSIVTLGVFQAIKVDAGYGAIEPGDLLVSSPTPGHAMRADDPRTGTVIGKALEALETGTGTIAVMVTLQ